MAPNLWEISDTGLSMLMSMSESYSHNSAGTAPPARRQAGFTLIEMLIVLVVMAVLLLVATVSLQRWQNKVNAENFVQAFAAQMNLARTQTMSTGNRYRVNLTNASTFQVEKETAPNSNAWSVVGTPFSNSAVSFSTTGARIFRFDTRGLMTAFNSSGTVTLSTNLTVTLPVGQPRTIIVTALGLTRGV